MVSNIELNRDNTFVISLKNRSDRREKITKELERNNIDFQFFDAIEDKNGTLGCFKSHTSIIRKAIESDLEYVFIMEDDCYFIDKFEVPNLPEEWDMLFFGGAVNKIYDDYYYHWKKASNWYAHCYIIHKSIFQTIIDLSEKLVGVKAIDEIYCEDIHPYVNSYVVYPTIASQYDNYSDIEKKELDRNQKVLNFDELMSKKRVNPKWIGDIYVINLNEREDKYEYMVNLCMKEKLNVRFLRVNKNENPARGCLESHLKILKEAKHRDLPNVCIFEDDVRFTQSLQDLDIGSLPENIGMLYLGGNHTENMGRWKDDSNLYRIRSWSTYGYMIYKGMYDILIDGLTNTKKEIDRYYIENIHPNYECYMFNPKVVTPNPDFSDSDIEGKSMDYSFLVDNIYIEENANQTEKVEKPKERKEFTREELPNVSIITPTMGRPNMFRLAAYNFLTINYPREKLEWIVIDEGDEPVRTLLPDDERITYYYVGENDRKQFLEKMIETKKSDAIKNLKENKSNKKESLVERVDKELVKVLKPHTKEDFYRNRLPIGLKRNLGVKIAKYDVICHMDDDDYYPPNSVYERVRTLLQNEDKQIVSCSAIASFNIIRMISMINVPPFDMSYEKRVSEATLCYYKKFWEDHKFDNSVICSEGESFLKDRVDKCLDIDWRGVIISLIHSKNFTSRSEMTEEPNGWHFGKIDDQLFIFITSLDNVQKKSVSQTN